MRLPPVWVRRVLLTPILPVAFVLLVVAFPVAVPIGAFVTRYLPGRLRVLSLLWLGFVWLLRETIAVVLLFGLWIASGFGARMDAAWCQHRHVRLIGWYLRGLVSVAQGSLGLRLVTEAAPGELVVEPRTTPRPMVVLSRHAGVGDSFILLHLLLNVFGRWPGIVLKDTLQWLPSLDIALNRMGAAFVAPGQRAAVLAAIGRLARDLREDGALVIFPEGGNFSVQRRDRALQRLERDDLSHLLQRARELERLLPPRTAGVRAALAANDQADVVVVAHTGLEGYADARQVLARLPMQHSVRLALWHVGRAEVPAVADDHDTVSIAAGDRDDGLADWLYEWWEHVDTWVSDHDEPGVPDEAPIADNGTARSGDEEPGLPGGRGEPASRRAGR